MKLTKGLIAAIAAAFLAGSCTTVQLETNYAGYVDTSIGTGGHGHVFVGANVPFGAVQLGPTSIPQAWDWTSGYHVSDSTVIGFSHTHLSGTGIGDLFDITVMPVTGEGVVGGLNALKYARGTEDDPQSGLWSYADRSKEISVPGYYSVPLARYNILAELTSTSRVGFHKYTFPASEEAAIIFDLENGGCWDKVTKSHIEKVDGKNAVRGYRYSSGWAKDQKIWFYAETDHDFAFENIGTNYGKLSFETAEGEKVMMKVAISHKNQAGAEANMAAELPGWDFEAVREDAQKAWNEELSKIKIDTKNETDRTIFYTALYHSMIVPAEFNDASEPTEYTTLSLWDTYRAAMPFFSIIHPEKENDLIRTMIDIYKVQGKLPVWHLVGNETDCMVGNPGIPVVADAILKGFDGFDIDLAYESLVQSAMRADRGQDFRMKYGYIPNDKFGESVAYDLEYALADWAVAQVALKLADTTEDATKKAGYEKDYNYFIERSHSYRHLFDPELGFIRGKDSKGNFRKEYSPFSSSHRADDYCEGNGWQYTWLVPHDLDGLVNCFGSKEKLINKLDQLFTVSSIVEGEESSPDISGLIGQYAHGNEPSHHILYFYTMLGQPWKTADLVREVLSTLYHAAPDGIAGNEDAGQMSSWYILSALGFYQVEPAGGRYFFGSPIFDKAEIKVKHGTFRIEVQNNSNENKYIQSISLNGKSYVHPYIMHSDIEKGGELIITMGSEPEVWYCANEPRSYKDQRPVESERLFSSAAVEREIERICALLENPRLRWMFANCYPNTLDTTVHYGKDEDGNPDTFVYTGDIPAMWLRDSGAQVWPYVRYAHEDPKLRDMIAGVINRQFKCINIDPYANAFNVEPLGAANKTDWPVTSPYVFERKWEIDSHCYPIRLAYEYWKVTGDESVFGPIWEEAIEKIYETLKTQQRKNGEDAYQFLRITDRQLDTKCVVGRGNPVNPVGLICSAFRPSDDATTFEFLVPSNFMAVSSLKKASEILTKVNANDSLAKKCLELAEEVEKALKEYAIYEHPEFGQIYAFEVDGFGNQFIMDDANVPSLLAMSYLGDVPTEDPIYQNTRNFVWSKANPYYFEGPAGEGIGGPHIGHQMIWPMSIMMKAFTSHNPDEIRECIMQLMTTDAGTGFIHESFHKDNAENFTRPWFAWQNTLFGELILKIVNDGNLDVLNSII